MNISPKAACFDDDCLWVELEDGRTIGAPLAWFPRVFQATKDQREVCELSRSGLQWEAPEEDISIAGILVGQGDMTHTANAAA